MKILFKLLFSVLILAVFSGCSIYGVAVDERSVNTIASDQTIVMKISSKLLENKSIKFLDLSTYCYRGHVYLVGEYDEPKQKEVAIRIANSVPGVKSVTTYMLEKKKSDLCGTTDNIEISSKVKAKLIQDKEIKSTNIDIKVVQCNVVLLGIVGSEKEITRAIAHAKSVEKIRGVESFLKSTR